MVPYGGSATGNGVGSFDSNGVLRVSSLFFPSVSFYLEYIYVYFIIYIYNVYKKYIFSPYRQDYNFGLTIYLAVLLRMISELPLHFYVEK